ncbi:MAG: thiamine diphosphokinase [Candidatus Kapabacteria bacterium]|nr:thiamine diphosphokinase [Candidatus Kapabacteria bacterium]
MSKKAEKNIFKLEFNNLKFDCIIALDGSLPPIAFFKKMEQIPILAADGAAISLIKKRIRANYVIGDLDTFKSSPFSVLFEDNKIIHLPSQELNDFEKTLIFAEENGFKNLMIIGFHGGELEHTLNNWSVLKKYSEKLNLCLLDRNRYGIPLNKSCIFSCKMNEMISLIPQPEVTLTTQNLKWNLKNEKLELGVREGARNVAISDNIKLEIHSGELLLFIDSRLPYAPEFLT